MSIQTAILTVGDRYLSGQARDEGGEILNSICLKMGWGIVVRQVIGDAEPEMVAVFQQIPDSGTVDVLFTVDGIGMRPEDRVPEAMYQVCEKWVPGLPELMRGKAYEKTPGIALTRGVAGVRGKTLLINLPGSPTAVKDAMDVLRPVLRLAVEQVKGTTLQGP